MSQADGSPPSAVLSVENLSKAYGGVSAVRDVGFEVGAGQIFGLLGPNGAGKTTILECILGLRRPDRGSIRIDGDVGAALQASALQDKITPRQALDLFGSFYRHQVPTADLLERFGLLAKSDTAFAALSGGQRQRLFLALAVVNQPRLLVLDEPTAGLDSRVRRELRQLILDVRAEGRSILLSTHDIDEAEQICDQVAILHEGRIVAAGAPRDLIGRAGVPVRVMIRTSPELSASAVGALPTVLRAGPDAGGWILETHEPKRLLAEVVRHADQVGAELLDVELRRATLEDVFLELTGSAWAGDVAEPVDVP